jgi:hypothetical protein
MTAEQRVLFEKLRTLAAATLVDPSAREAFVEAAGPMTVLVLLGDIEAKQRGYDGLHQMVPGPGDIWTKVDALLKRLATMTTARDEACGIAESAITMHGDFIGRHGQLGSARIVELRKIGAP